MATTVADHYLKHLGPVYTWMIGDIGAAISRGELELDTLSLPSKGAGTAVDLGAGFGMHAIPLARRGFSVVAIDSYEPLLRELAARAESLPIRTIEADLLDFRRHLKKAADVITCMGDTLTHLPTHESVATLFREIASSLERGGIFAATFRDYDTAPLRDDSRFILVRADGERVLTCYLEYADTTVTVHDLLHQRENGAAWQLRVSSYPKLRLAPQWVIEQLTSLGLTVRLDTAPGGMVRIRAAAA
jgi:2-polyprenyl-3-methyl-5-hydroxy-6-metoxy-1,4-benzoquinol methylase